VIIAIYGIAATRRRVHRAHRREGEEEEPSKPRVIRFFQRFVASRLLSSMHVVIEKTTS